jgi:inner membrane protein
LHDRKALPFRLRFALKGHEQLSMLPLARDLTFTVSGKHPHPSFADGVLPNQRNVSKTGFSASWQVSEFNRHFAQINLRTTSSEHLDKNVLSMRLVQQGEIYQRNDRAGKYSFLFLGLSIACFFLIEVVLRLNLHPMHYLQLGLGLGLFYLLLLALSEHIGFNYAYLSAASATTLLITGYCKAVMRSWRRASLAAGVIALMYGFLFLLLSRQQSSLLIGAIGLFVLLSIIMYMTRHLDWNRGDFGRVEQAA